MLHGEWKMSYHVAQRFRSYQLLSRRNDTHGLMTRGMVGGFSLEEDDQD